MYFLITIDTEGDDIWSSPKSITTENSRYLPRFQQLCEKFGFRPTYLTNYEMAVCPVYQEFAKDYLARDVAELGMHLHAWNSPPECDLTGDDYSHKPYLVEYPLSVMNDKIQYMTDILEQTFGIKVVSHRAGRWAFNGAYAAILERLGYKVDCSVTPGVNWSSHKGDPGQNGGTDYRNFPAGPYYLDLNNIGQQGSSKILELPMTIYPRYSLPVAKVRRAINKIKGKERAEAVNWMRPNGKNLELMKKVALQAKRQAAPYIEFMLHSSEFMPGGSPTFQTEAAIDKLYEDMEALFEFCSSFSQGATLAEFASHYEKR